MTQADETRAVIDKIEMIGTQIFANLTTVTGTDLNRIELLVTQLGSDELVAKQAKLEPLLDDFKNKVWEFVQEVVHFRDQL